MGIFGDILKKLGFGAQAAAPAAQAAAPAAASSASSAPSAIPVVDVVANLEKMAAASKEKLNWRTSIVDLLKLLGLDSSLSARKSLAEELGRSGFSGTAEDNIWLHKTVLQKIADNGGNIPADLRN